MSFNIFDEENIEYDIYDEVSDDSEQEDTTESYLIQIQNDLKLLEFNRKFYNFYYKGDEYNARPIAKLNDKYYIFDVDNKLKKFCIDDMSFK